MKGIENLFNEIIAESFQIWVVVWTIMYKRHFKLQMDMIRKEQPHDTS
jgi:hypothetical protein